MADNSNGTTIRFLGNINTLWIIGSAVVVFAGQWFLYGYRLDDVKKGVDDLRAGSANLGGQVQTLNITAGRHEVQINNLQERLAELSRQARLGTYNSPYSYDPKATPR